MVVLVQLKGKLYQIIIKKNMEIKRKTNSNNMLLIQFYNMFLILFKPV